MFKTIDHQFVIRFLPSTTIEEVLTATHVIYLQKFKLQKFMLCQYDDHQTLSDTNLEILGILLNCDFVSFRFWIR